MQPRSLDEARRLMPHIGFALYAYEPGGEVLLELHNHGEVALTWSAPTEAEVWLRAFPDEEPANPPPPPAPIELETTGGFFD